MGSGTGAGAGVGTGAGDGAGSGAGVGSGTGAGVAAGCVVLPAGKSSAKTGAAGTETKTTKDTAIRLFLSIRLIFDIIAPLAPPINKID